MTNEKSRGTPLRFRPKLQPVVVPVSPDYVPYYLETTDDDGCWTVPDLGGEDW